jgi:hypothetical protein
MEYPEQNGRIATMGQAGAPAHPAPAHATQAGIAVAESPFRCHICEEPSKEICPRCTRDVCDNHICEHCAQCSDCCDCEWTHR